MLMTNPLVSVNLLTAELSFLKTVTLHALVPMVVMTAMMLNCSSLLWMNPGIQKICHVMPIDPTRVTTTSHCLTVLTMESMI